MNDDDKAIIIHLFSWWILDLCYSFCNMVEKILEKNGIQRFRYATLPFILDLNEYIEIDGDDSDGTLEDLESRLDKSKWKRSADDTDTAG